MNLKEEREKYCKEHPIDYVKMLELLNQYPSKYEAWNAIYNVIKLYVPDEVYKYYSLTEDEKLNNLKFETLENSEVYTSHSNDFNDPFDNRSFYYDIEVAKKYKFGYFFDEHYTDNNIKMTRFTSFSAAGVSNLPMWAHYSNNHQGYCVSYSTDFKYNSELSPSLFPVQYIDGRIDITSYLEIFLKHMEIKYNEAIKEKQHEILIENLMPIWIVILTSCIKEKKWDYEQEFRVMKPSNVPKAEYIKAKPSAIYIGHKCNDEHKMKLVNIAFSLNIPIYQMTINPASQSFELIPKQIYIR